MKHYFRIIGSILLIIFLVQSMSIISEAKTTRYSASLVQTKVKKYEKDKWAYVYSVQIKKNKLIVYGSLLKYHEVFEKGKLLPHKKRVFKLSKNTKYSGYSGDDIYHFSRKGFMKKYRKFKDSQLGFGIVVKKGYVSELYITS